MSMNLDDRITDKTRVFGFLAHHAKDDPFLIALNKSFEATAEDAMCLPMNIRPEDFRFVLANLGKSHLRGVALAPEFQEKAAELVDEKSEALTESGRCSIIAIKDGKLHGDVLETDAQGAAPAADVAEAARAYWQGNV